MSHIGLCFLEKFLDANFRPVWISPAEGFIGNHIIARNESLAFDYQGYSRFGNFIFIKLATGH